MELIVGRVIRAHGIKGETVVEIRTDDPAGRFKPGAVLGTDPGRAGPLTVRSVRPHQGRLLVAFAEVADRSAAETLRGVRLVVEAPTDPGQPPDGDGYYDQQLIGMRVLSSDGELVGVVAEVRHLPGQDVLVVRRVGLAEGSGELTRPDERRADVLVPFVRDIVPEVDLAAGRVVLTPPPGLLDR